MTIQLNHLIIPARDKHASARFLADILGIADTPSWGRFVSVQTDNGVTLDFADSDDFRPQHWAFLVSDAEFDAGMERLREKGVAIYAGPGHAKPGEINHLYGGCGVYFDDPDGHLMELITAPYGEQNQTIYREA